MSHAEEMFHRSTDPLDRAYWRGAIDGEAAKQERIIELLQREASEWISHDGECDCRVKSEENLRLVALIGIWRVLDIIEGENE